MYNFVYKKVVISYRSLTYPNKLVLPDISVYMKDSFMTSLNKKDVGRHATCFKISSKLLPITTPKHKQDTKKHAWQTNLNLLVGVVMFSVIRDSINMILMNQ
ncbi:CLUMA_CG004733, isoform A [Clunio marinus]|uniref:CLUMA_CG004733, isoform A n=1 Tax=Clunio marinus TaxID=568069 RepID=A0A1J1HSR4_9DIPT|nr:CLUMA_CG004733, isoform A [Clunio marinus]